ncbi:MAG: tetratricopeptide repeat protein [bacterium]|nr:tetratricopeptide repeat protein [bacterium]
MGFIAVYKDPSKKKLQKIEIAVLLIALVISFAVGIPSYRNYLLMKEAIAYHDQVHEMIHAGQEDQALELLEKAVSTYPMPETYEEIAAIYYFRSDSDNVIKTYERAVKQLPNDPTLHWHLSQTLFVLKRYDEALKEAQEAQRLAPNDKHIKDQVNRCERLAANPEAAPDVQDKEELERMLKEAAEHVHDHDCGHDHEHGDGHDHEHEHDGEHHEH